MPPGNLQEGKPYVDASDARQRQAEIRRVEDRLAQMKQALSSGEHVACNAERARSRRAAELSAARRRLADIDRQLGQFRGQLSRNEAGKQRRLQQSRDRLSAAIDQAQSNSRQASSLYEEGMRELSDLRGRISSLERTLAEMRRVHARLSQRQNRDKN